jgi:hypothetical protein
MFFALFAAKGFKALELKGRKGVLGTFAGYPLTIGECPMAFPKRPTTRQSQSLTS